MKFYLFILLTAISLSSCSLNGTQNTHKVSSDYILERGFAPLSGLEFKEMRYSYGNNRWMVYFSKIAYWPEEQVKEELKRKELFDTDLVFVNHEESGAQAYIFHNKDGIIVAFRGTDGAQDMLIDLNFLKKRVKHGKVHRGFSNQFKGLIPIIDQKLIQLKAKNKQVLITGHSLGGALAAFYAAEHNQQEIPFLRGIYTYGQPRIGDQAFATYLDKQFARTYIRITSESDKIPTVPKAYYEHAGIEINYNKDGRPICGKSSNEGLARDYWGLITSTKQEESAHSVLSYYKLVWQPSQILLPDHADKVVDKKCKKLELPKMG